MKLNAGRWTTSKRSHGLSAYAPSPDAADPHHPPAHVLRKAAAAVPDRGRRDGRLSPSSLWWIAASRATFRALRAGLQAATQRSRPLTGTPTTALSSRSLSAGAARPSEIKALQWHDFDFVNMTLLIQRSMVHGKGDEVKTEYSRDYVPLDPALVDILLPTANGGSRLQKAGCSPILQRAALRINSVRFIRGLIQRPCESLRFPRWSGPYTSRGGSPGGLPATPPESYN